MFALIYRGNQLKGKYCSKSLRKTGVIIMIFSETYKKYAWEFIVENYRTNLQVYSQKYFKVLAKHKKIFLSPDGTVLLDASNAQESGRNFIMYSCEITAYLNAVSFNVLDTNNNNLFYGEGLVELTDEIKKYEEMLSDTSFGLDEKGLDGRVFEYWDYENNNVGFGFSLPRGMKYEAEREKLAAMFTDHIVSKDVVPDFISYQQMEDIYKSYSNPQYASDIYMIGLELYDAVKKQSAPYVTGSIIDVRKSKGLCEDCGGTYKGLFKKKCSVCGAEKR